MKHVAASTAARFNFSFADGCFNVWSPLSPICPCAIQLTSGERPVYDSTFSSSLSSRSARKTQVRSRKKTADRKKTRLAAGKKRLAAGKSCFRSGKKTPAKNAASQREKFKAAEKTPCSSTKAPLQQKKCILEAAGKNRPRREKTRPRQEKNRPRQEKNQQQRKSSFATQKVAATEKIHFRNGKKQQPPKMKQGRAEMVFIQRSAGQSDSIVQQTNNFNQRRKGNLGGQNCSKSEHEYIHRPHIVKTCFTCKRYTVKSHAWENQQHACYSNTIVEVPARLNLK